MCGRWLVSPTSRSCASGPIATGRAPSALTKPWSNRNRSGAVAAVGVRNHVAVEELRRGASRPARLGPADRVAADEALVRRGRRADRPLRRADVGDRRSLGRVTEDSSHGLGKVADRRRDEHEVGVGDGGGQVVGRLDGAAFRGERERLTVRIPSRHGPHACATGGQRGRGADQARADDGEPLYLVKAHAFDRGGRSPEAIMRPASTPRRGRRGRATAGR